VSGSGEYVLVNKFYYVNDEIERHEKTKNKNSSS
jgi:hypothetical protein